MKKLFFLILATFSALSSAAESDTKIPFTKESGKYWQYISDRTMGGISEGQAVLEQEGEMFFARLTGNVSTANNGGFIQLRTNLSFFDFEKDLTKIKGVKLNVSGNGETYHIFIRTDKTRSYRDYYSSTFIANSNWEVIDLPLSSFKHRFSNNFDLEGKNLRTFGIVAYGRDFESDISVSEIIFYY